MRVVQAIKETRDDAKSLAQSGRAVKLYLILVKSRVPVKSMELGVIIVIFHSVVRIAKDTVSPSDIEAVHRLLSSEFVTHLWYRDQHKKQDDPNCHPTGHCDPPHQENRNGAYSFQAKPAPRANSSFQ